MGCFTHHFETTIELHPVGRYHHTVVYLPAAIAAEPAFTDTPRLRVEADVSGVPVHGAWQPSNGRRYLMLPKGPLRQAGLTVGSRVEVAFKLADPDEVVLPAELAQLLATEPDVRSAWQRLTPGKQRGLAFLIASAKRPDTRQARLAQVRGVVLGLLPEPWKRPSRTARAGT